MRAALVALLLAACAPQTATVAPASAARAASSSDADLQALVRRLSVHHASSDCDALADGLGDPRVALRRAALEVEAPAWVGLIAGQCLASRYGAQEEALVTSWLLDPEMAGLGRLIVRGLATEADEALVLRLGRAALDGPNAALAADLLGRDPRPAVRGLVAR